MNNKEKMEKEKKKKIDWIKEQYDGVSSIDTYEFLYEYEINNNKISNNDLITLWDYICSDTEAVCMTLLDTKAIDTMKAELIKRGFKLKEILHGKDEPTTIDASKLKLWIEKQDIKKTGNLNTWFNKEVKL